jgi:hypothetical protein
MPGRECLSERPFKTTTADRAAITKGKRTTTITKKKHLGLLVVFFVVFAISVIFVSEPVGRDRDRGSDTP